MLLLAHYAHSAAITFQLLKLSTEAKKIETKTTISLLQRVLCRAHVHIHVSTNVLYLNCYEFSSMHVGSLHSWF